MLMEGDLTWGSEHTIQYTDDVLWNYTSETCIILLITNVTPINSIKKKNFTSSLDYFESLSLTSTLV